MVLTTIVTVTAIVAAALCLAVGTISAIAITGKRREVIAALKPPTPPSTKSGVPPPVTNQSVATTIESVSKLAAALKDLDRVAQMFTLALGFLAIAAISAGVDTIVSVVK